MKEIKLYTTPTCGFCLAAKRLLEEKGLPFEDIDVARNPELRKQLAEQNGGYRTVPMIFIGNEFIGGYQELLGLERTGSLNQKVRGA